MSQVLDPRLSGKLIAEHAVDVKISTEGIKKVADQVLKGFHEQCYSLKSWKEHELHPKQMDKAAIDWIFVVDTLNFSFWSEDPNKKFGINFNGKIYTGYWSLCAALNRALQENIPITDPNFYSSITKEQLQRIFRSDTDSDMPLLQERCDVLREAGSVLMQKFGGSFTNCIKQSGNSAATLIKLVVENFTSYRDEAEFNDRRVSFYKRAQILVADVWACFENQGLGEFHDIDSLTMFADYRVAQVLAHFGAMQYSEDLLKRLETGDTFTSGERQEQEIRGCSIHAVELVKKELQDKGIGDKLSWNSCLIDFYLWDYRRSHSKKIETVPFHRVRCIYY